eukprot:gene10402-13971_t
MEFSNINSTLNCDWKPFSANDQPEIFWINMDKSENRRKSLAAHLQEVGLRNRRIKGVSLDDIYFPVDVISTWDNALSKVTSSDAHVYYNQTLLSSLSNAPSYSHIMIGMCGRKKANRLKEIGCTSSHLDAIYTSIYHNKTANRYAVIVEDDIEIPFDIDFNEMAKSAPAGFGILQLFNSNEDSMAFLWKKYLKSGNLWTERYPKQMLAFWSTCAYLIDREVLKPIIDNIIFEYKGYKHMRIIAGIKHPCQPKFTECCLNTTTGANIIYDSKKSFNPPCIFSPLGFQADAFIYAIARSFVLGVPIITNSLGGNESTMHQDHVENFHQSAFRRQRTFINQMITKKVASPSFIRMACSNPIPELMPVKLRPPCAFQNRTSDVNSAAIYWINNNNNGDNNGHSNQLNVEHYFNHIVGRRNVRINLYNMSLGHIYILDDVKISWTGMNCKLLSSKVTKRLTNNTYSSKPDMITSPYAVKLSSYDISEIQYNKIEVIVSGLCGRGKGQNDYNDLNKIISHLIAIYKAVNHYNQKTSSRYAIITEDDIFFAFDLNELELFKFIPSDFLFLRLFDGYESSLLSNTQKYIQNNSFIFSNQNNGRIFDDFSTKAYLIDCLKMKPIIEKIISMIEIEYILPVSSQIVSKIVYNIQIIGGLFSPCIPTGCCEEKNNKKVFHRQSPCILSRYGFIPEKFLFSLGPTYMISVPFLTTIYNNIPLNVYNPIHRINYNQTIVKSLKTQKGIINDFITGKYSLPSFAKYGCIKLI